MQTVRVNLKALELAKSIQWEFYTSSSLVYNVITTDKMKVKFLSGCFPSCPMLIIAVLLLSDPPHTIFLQLAAPH
jgi:hypothetical protein